MNGMHDISISEYMTTYHDGRGNTFEAVKLPWAEVTRILGRPHDGTASDDHALDAAIATRSPDRPAWYPGVSGWVDDEGWGVYGPEIES